MAPLHEQTFGADVPTYEAVLQLDKRLCSFPIPPILRLPELSSNNNNPVRYPVTIGLTLQRHIVLAIREISKLTLKWFYLPLFMPLDRLYLHRSFFAKAITDYPQDPLQSPYRNSILAAYRCAQIFVRLMHNLHTQAEIVCGRLWFLWAHMFSCSVSVPCRLPGFV
jgi:hypothetical protein